MRKTYGEKFNAVQKLKVTGAPAAEEATEHRPLLISERDDIHPIVDKVLALIEKSQDKLVNVSISNSTLEELFNEVLDGCEKHGRINVDQRNRIVVKARTRIEKKRKTMKQAFEASYNLAVGGGEGPPPINKTGWGTIDTHEELAKARIKADTYVEPEREPELDLIDVLEEEGKEVEEKSGEEDSKDEDCSDDHPEQPAIELLQFETEVAETPAAAESEEDEEV